MNFGAGLGEGGWDDDGALRAALGRTAEGLGLDLPEWDGKWDRLAEYVNARSGRRVMVYPPGAPDTTLPLGPLNTSDGVPDGVVVATYPAGAATGPTLANVSPESEDPV